MRNLPWIALTGRPGIAAAFAGCQAQPLFVIGLYWVDGSWASAWARAARQQTTLGTWYA